MNKKMKTWVSQEVVNHWTRAAILVLLVLAELLHPVGVVFRCRIEDVKVALSPIANFEHTGQISAPVAVIRRTPYCA